MLYYISYNFPLLIIDRTHGKCTPCGRF